jgi:hypothetical protein
MNSRLVAIVASLAVPAAGCAVGAPDTPPDTGAHVASITSTETTSLDAAALHASPPDQPESHAGGRAPKLRQSFRGLNHREQRFANGGNDPNPVFDKEPPDQALCVGNGFVLEGVNNALRVFNKDGNALSSPVGLNQFYGYPPEISGGATPTFGPTLIDPSCYFDQATERWFFLVSTTDRFPDNGAANGDFFLDLAVSATASPLGAWKIYHVHAENDGTDGTPNHNCSGGPCLPDFPHLGADEHGLYITTNEFDPFGGTGFQSANIYAFSKAQIVTLPDTLNVTVLETRDAVAPGEPGHTLWPAVSPGDQYEHRAHGTEYFVSSDANPSVNPINLSSDRLIVWALTNTRSLDWPTPALTLRRTLVPVDPYRVPPQSDQKAGPFPLGQCINDTTLSTPLGLGCWRLLFATEPDHTEVEGKLDSSDSRMLTLTFAHGKLWGALDTGVTVGCEERAGAAWFILDPTVSYAGVWASVVKQGVLSLPHNNVIFPTIAVTRSGRGVMGFNLTGRDYFPSAAYATLDESAGLGAINLIAAGLGPQDGFTEYKAFNGGVAVPRWGDYGAAVADGDSLWIASEYIAQTCNLATYLATSGSCGNKRNALANWATRVSEIGVRGEPDHSGCDD